MKKIAIVTSTRAEYGLLQPVIKEFRKHESPDFKADLIVTGTHLSQKHGYTVDEIEASGDRIDHRITAGVDSDTPENIAHNEADTVIGFTELFDHEKYAAVVLLGDRYEILMVALAAVNTRTPIFHISGGDTTEGAIDECFRHSITKMSYLHFPVCEESRDRIIQMGEDPKRVFNVGSTANDNILRSPLLASADVLKDLGLPDTYKYAICTYHPVTMSDGDVEAEVKELIDALVKTPDVTFIVTKANSDLGGEKINEIWEEAEKKYDNIHLFSSLGMKRYLSLLKDAQFMIGNSSSGVAEAPVMHVPTVNIGDRQRGRRSAESIINCPIDADAIKKAIDKAMTPEMKEIAKTVVSPFGDGHSSEQIVKISLDTINKGNINLMKTFYNIDLK